jgi:hypothetical protein
MSFSFGHPPAFALAFVLKLALALVVLQMAFSFSLSVSLGLVLHAATATTMHAAVAAATHHHHSAAAAAATHASTSTVSHASHHELATIGRLPVFFARISNLILVSSDRLLQCSTITFADIVERGGVFRRRGVQMAMIDSYQCFTFNGFDGIDASQRRACS